MNITDKAQKHADSCRFCWMCRHICPIGNATGLERNTARARALGASMVVRGSTELKEIADNVYECTLCGACTNNCMTGWDPKVFIQELKTEIKNKNNYVLVISKENINASEEIVKTYLFHELKEKIVNIINGGL